MAKKTAKSTLKKKAKPRAVKSAEALKPDTVTATETEKTRSGYTLKDATVEQDLVSGENRDLLEAYFGEAAYEDLRALALRAQTARVRGGPRVLILPGIMGSKLGVDKTVFDDTIWIDPLDIARGRLSDLSLDGGAADIQALGVVLFTYLKLKLRLKVAGLDADFHPYDWRQDVRQLGQHLAARIRSETGSGSGRESLYIVAHSMGGLVSRAGFKRLEDQGEGDRVQRLIMLGTPNNGSFSPVQVFSGSHSLVKKVAAVDLSNTHHELVNNVFNTFTGLYQMLPARSVFTGIDLYNPENWPPSGIGPRPAALAAAPDVHGALASGRDRFILIAGINQETIVNVRRVDDKFVYGVSLEGDGTVPLAFAQLENVTTYFAEETHGSLPNNGDVERAVIELIETGRTNVLTTRWTPSRQGILRELSDTELEKVPFGGRAGENISQREVRLLIEEFAAPMQRKDAPISIPASAGMHPISQTPIVIGRKRQQRIDIRLAHGSITQVDTRAIVLGLFSGVAPSGAARAIDQQLEGVITDFTERRMLSARVGEVFIMPANRYRMGADMVAFIGLGSYDDFNEEILRLAAENVARALVRTKVDEFATVLMSSGSGLGSADVLSNLVKGFMRGIQEGDAQGRLRGITFCEANHARFAQMHREMLRLSTTRLFDALEATVEIQTLPPAPIGAAAPPRSTPITRDPIYLIVREMQDIQPEVTDAALGADFTLRASVLTAGNKSTVVTDTIDVVADTLNDCLQFIETRAFSPESLEGFGTKLADLVLPPLTRKALGGTRDRSLVVIHDARTSRIPWETVYNDDHFLSTGAGLSRKYEAEDLSVAKWLEERRIAPDLKLLLVVNPTEDLPGADAEGARIEGILKADPRIHITKLERREATWSAVRAAFRSGQYDVVHYAGHAFFDPYKRARSGIICHGRQVLSGADLASLETLPALMFFNACESGRVRSVKARQKGAATAKRLETNVGLAEALLRAGVGNYIGTHWPVGDASATQFGETFYRAIIDGKSIGDSLQLGRLSLRTMSPPSVDWANYIHYGSPHFVVKHQDQNL